MAGQENQDNTASTTLKKLWSRNMMGDLQPPSQQSLGEGAALSTSLIGRVPKPYRGSPIPFPSLSCSREDTAVSFQLLPKTPEEMEYSSPSNTSTCLKEAIGTDKKTLEDTTHVTTICSDQDKIYNYLHQGDDMTGSPVSGIFSIIDLGSQYKVSSDARELEQSNEEEMAYSTETDLDITDADYWCRSGKCSFSCHGKPHNHDEIIRQPSTTSTTTTTTGRLADSVERRFKARGCISRQLRHSLYQRRRSIRKRYPGVCE